jgi:heat shock protein HtpX
MLTSNGLYGHIQRNELKSGLLLGSFVLLICVFWYAWCVIFTAMIEVWWPHNLTPYADRRSLPPVPGIEQILLMALERALERWWVPLVLSALWFIAAYFIHADLIRAATGARAVTRLEQPRLYKIVETLAISAGLPMPRVEIMPTSVLNAYAAGLDPAVSAVAVTRGLLDTLDDDELEAVLAHEIAHIRNHDVRLMVFAAIFTGGLTLIGDGVARFFASRRSRASTDDEENSGFTLTSGSGRSGGGLGAALPVVMAIVVAVLLLATTHLLAVLARFAISRSREYAADAGAVELTKNPDALISALRKITGHDEIPGLNANLRAMMFSADAAVLFSTHPPVEARIEALRLHAGGVALTRSHERPRPSQVGASRAALTAAGGALAGARMAFGKRRQGL